MINGPAGGIARLITVAKLPLPARSVVQNPIQLAHPLGTAKAGEGQRAPGDAQRDPQGRLVGPVPGDVADHDVHGAVGGLDEVVEVTAEQCVLPARPVAGDDLDTRIVQQQGRRQQPAFKSCVLRAREVGLHAVRRR